ncbi:hypothetical protein Solca_2200 [Solitalea canadensis DSM 3403]|uniref:Uncharacterized protein n=1 Tax=Solitalea canadensis (strain ATCC 29591 / DSM 3403 / JCM 21819 / LMG 8368 / NBRC 15130 / NCIMB 12057 / USAM 9D) TaxID=929556 RepID=H8KR40_SOLCM|nr:hypothetical protein Solca_2200 [Solitalea canadensis DSM 3403]
MTKFRWIAIPVIALITVFIILCYLRTVGYESFNLMVFLSWLCFLLALLSIVQVYVYHQVNGIDVKLRFPRVLRLVVYIFTLHFTNKYLLMAPFVSAIAFNLPILLMHVILGIFIFFLDTYDRV